MEGAGEQPRKGSTRRPAEEVIRLEAHASDQARVNQAARDLHVHYADGVRGGRRAEPGAATAECPYPGLAAFGRAQARWFFGREQLTAELIERLDGRLRTGGLQVVVAPSGAGKSSLLRAGLLPKLGDGALPGSGRWPTVVFTPTAQPLAALASQIAALTGADPGALAEQLMADSQQAEPVPRDRIRGVDSGAPLVMVVDQFEELFTLCTDDRQRHTFIELLAQIADPQSGIGPDSQPVGLVVVGLRADFYATCVNYPPLRTALQDGPLVVGSMSDAELRAAILYPAQEVGLDIDPGLVELLLRDLGDIAAAAGEGGTAGYAAGRLPLLAHALRATWQQRHGHILTVEGYRTTGGIRQAVATTADRVFTGLDPADQDEARTLFLRLIKIGDGTENTRRRMTRTDLLQGLDPDSALPVLDAFTRGRLLTQEQDTVEITHEALLRAWPRLRQWIETDRAGNLTRQELDEAAAVWDRNHRDTATLYRGSRLDVARTWAATTPHEGDLSPTAAAFLAASTHYERRVATLRRTVLAMLSVLTLVATTGAVIALVQSDNLRRERDNATFNQIIAQADRLRSTDVSLAAQLDLTAYRMRPNPDLYPNLYTSLVTAGNAALSTPLTGHTGRVLSVGFSPDGRILASAGGDGAVRLWNAADPTRTTSLGSLPPGHTDTVSSVVFSPDGRILASGGDDRTVRLWNVTDPTNPTPLGALPNGHTDWVFSVGFSPDGRILASSSRDGTVRLWNVADPTQPIFLGSFLPGHTEVVSSVVFSPDGRTLASAGGDGTVRLWNVSDPANSTSLGAPLIGDTGTVFSAVFSPDGRTLASAGGDGTVRLWNVTDPANSALLGTLPPGHTGTIFSLVFSRDGRTLASAGGDGTVRLWNVADPTRTTFLGAPLIGHTSSVLSVVFSPDGRALASAGGDGTVRLWNIPSAIITSHTDRVSSVVFSPDGRILASGSDDRTVRLWNVTDPTNPTPLVTLPNGHTDAVSSVVFSPDGRTLASGGNDGTVRLWNVADPTNSTSLGEPLIGHTGAAFSVVFSPDGRTLASGGDDRTARLWNVADPTNPTPLSEPLIGHTNRIFSVVFSPDGRTLASASGDGTVLLWNVTDPSNPTSLGAPLIGHTNTVFSVVFSPDGRTLASASGDGTVRLWNVTDRANPSSRGQPLTGHTDFVDAVVFSPDGRTLASSGTDHTVRLWGMNIDQAIQRICATTTNTFTSEKWEQYVSTDLPYNPPCS